MYNGHERVRDIKLQSAVTLIGLNVNLLGPVEFRKHDSGKFSGLWFCILNYNNISVIKTTTFFSARSSSLPLEDIGPFMGAGVTQIQQ